MAEDPKLAEFRETNIALKKENGEQKDTIAGLQKQITELTARFDGIDPAVVKADRAKLTEYESAKPNERIAALETQLADANKRANGAILKDAIDNAFLKAGGRPNAVDYIRMKAADKFTVDANGAIVGSAFDPQNPGVKLTIEAFLTQQLHESSFAFLPSSGSGATGSVGGGGRPRSGAKELRNPDAAALGRNADAIKRGEVKVVYED